jgi:hypothetical protein
METIVDFTAGKNIGDCTSWCGELLPFLEIFNITYQFSLLTWAF